MEVILKRVAVTKRTAKGDHILFNKVYNKVFPSRRRYRKVMRRVKRRYLPEDHELIFYLKKKTHRFYIFEMKNIFHVFQETSSQDAIEKARKIVPKKRKYNVVSIPITSLGKYHEDIESYMRSYTKKRCIIHYQESNDPTIINE